MKLFKYSLIALISISLFSCKKDDDSNNNSDGYLSIMINGQQESFSMSDSDWNIINDGDCIDLISNPTTVDLRLIYVGFRVTNTQTEVLPGFIQIMPYRVLK